MGQGPEDEIESRVVAHAEARGWWVRKLSYPGRNGAPDRVFAKHGLTIFIEFKAPGEHPKAHQVREHVAMRNAGLEVHVCDSVDDALGILGLA